MVIRAVAGGSPTIENAASAGSARAIRLVLISQVPKDCATYPLASHRDGMVEWVDCERDRRKSAAPEATGRAAFSGVNLVRGVDLHDNELSDHED
jgi:hypothetical protein